MKKHWPAGVGRKLSELASLVTTVGQLQASIEPCRMAEQDAELTRLRARLAARQQANTAGQGNQ